MAEAWIYIDESQAPHATGTENGQPFWLGAIIVESPIADGLVEGALRNLEADPDALHDRRDRKTVTRGYFHASLDSKNAHSWISKAICGARLDADFSATLWYFDRPDSEGLEGARLHGLTALLCSSTAFQADFDAVHVAIAAREGSFGRSHAGEWLAYCRQTQLKSLVSYPAMPVRFPRVTLHLAKPDLPGVQVCDFILWAAQRARPVGLRPSGNSDWVERLKLRMWAQGGVEGGAEQRLRAVLGAGTERPTRPDANYPLSPRTPETMSSIERFELLRQIAADVVRAARLAPQSVRIGHLAPELEAAGCAWEGLRSGARRGNPQASLIDLLTGFLLVCDTLPVHDAADGAACVLAHEKRVLAAACLTGKLPVWLPEDASMYRLD